VGAIVSLHDLVKEYHSGGQVVVRALSRITLQVGEGDFVAVCGPSGSGKSTLLGLLGCLDRPTSGRCELDGVDVSELNHDGLSDLRGRLIGFVFQSCKLLPEYTVVENIEVPLLYQGMNLDAETRERSVRLAELVGLKDRLQHRPMQLSAGQQQRVAIARALAKDPRLILADEPTGNLDSRSGMEILELLSELNEAGKTIVMATHNEEVVRWTRRVVYLRDGEIEGEAQLHQHLEAPGTDAQGASTVGRLSFPGSYPPSPSAGADSL
jgi:putative ABC transport system ATP-binding protein